MIPSNGENFIKTYLLKVCREKHKFIVDKSYYFHNAFIVQIQTSETTFFNVITLKY